MSTRIALAAAVALVAVACGADTTDTTTTIPPDPPLAGDLGPEDRILEVRFEGGFAPIEFVFGRPPAYTLYGDGRLVSEAPVPAIFPGPLLTRFTVTQLTDARLGDLLAAVDAAGLPDIVDEHNDDAAQFVADAANTVITFTDAAGDHRFSVYALGLAPGDDPQLDRLQAIVDLLGQAGGGDTQELLTVDRLQILVTEDFGQANEPGSRIVQWPLPVLLADAPQLFDTLRCVVVEGDDVDALLPILEEADQLTFFDDGTGTYRLTPRPLLPSEAGCEEPA